MKRLAVALAALIALPAGAAVTRQTLVVHGSDAIVAWSDGRFFGFETCADHVCVPLGSTRAEADRGLVATALTAYLRDNREMLVYGDDAARARAWYWPGFAAGSAAFLAGLDHLHQSIKSPRAILNAAFAGAAFGIVLSVGIYNGRAPRDPGAPVHLLTNDPLVAENLRLEEHWDEPGARALVWQFLVTGLTRATAALPPATP